MLATSASTGPMTLRAKVASAGTGGPGMTHDGIGSFAFMKIRVVVGVLEPGVGRRTIVAP